MQKFRLIFAAICACMFATIASANTWYYGQGATAFCLTECDDQGTPIEGGWVLTMYLTESKSSTGRINGVLTQAVNNAYLDLSLPRAPQNTKGTIVGIQASAFKGNDYLEEVIFPDQCTFQNYCFQNCSTLRRISIKGATLATSPFDGCSRLTEVVCRGGMPSLTQTAFKNIGAGSFRYYVEDASLCNFSSGYTVYDKDNPPSSALSFANYQAKFNDGTVPSYVRNTSNNNQMQWVTIKPTISEDKLLAITGERITDKAKFEYGNPTPAYRGFEDIGTPPLNCSIDVNDKTVVVDGVRYEAFAYVISETVNSVLSNPVTNYTLSCSYDPADTVQRELKWLWRPVGYAVSVACPDALGSVSATAADADGVYTANTTVSLTATANAGAVFDHWIGDIGDADPTTATIAVTADRVRTVTPYFNAPWWFADATHLTDGYWTNTVTVVDDVIKLSAFPSSYKSVGGVQILDFRKGLPNGKKILTIPDEFLSRYNTATRQYVTEVYLPDTIEHVGIHAFYAQSSLRTVSPLLPDSVTSIGYGCFGQCPALSGTLRLGYGAGFVFIPPNNNFADGNFGDSGPNGRGVNVDTIDLGPAVTNLPAFIFFNCKNLDTVTFSKNFVKIDGEKPDGKAFKNAQAKKLIFEGEIPAAKNNTFEGWAAYKTCVYASLSRPSWAEVVADPTKFTPWKDPTLDKGLFTSNVLNAVGYPKGLMKSGVIGNLPATWLFDSGHASTIMMVY